MLNKLEEIVQERRAPLVEVDRCELGDKRLNPEEAVVQEREKCLKDASAFRIHGQAELEDPERSLGPRMDYTQIIARLQRVCPDLKVLDGSEGNVALYYQRTRKDYEMTVSEWDQHGKDDAFFKAHRYVGGFPKQELPEYSTVDIDTSLLPTREKRGWRSVLITLIKQGVLTYNDAVSAFGDVGTDRRGWRWNEQLHPWKQQPDNKFKQATEENRTV